MYVTIVRVCVCVGVCVMEGIYKLHQNENHNHSPEQKYGVYKYKVRNIIYRKS
jgi:hypothetical protein